MKKPILLIAFLLTTVCCVVAQNERKFDPQRFNQEMQQYITSEAGLTPQEAADFFPLYDELRKKSRVLFREMHRLKRFKPADENACKENIKRRDELDIQMKELQQIYHNKFFNVLPASKVYDVMKAEDSFHRKMFQKARAK
jgi:hypothetical protein